MEVTIHRGTKEIGGTCIEIRADASRLVLDLGQPITLPRDFPMPREASSEAVAFLEKNKVLPAVPGLYPGDPGPRPDALIVSHPHIDHYGLVRFADPAIPCVTGEASRKLMDLSQLISPFFSQGGIPDGRGMALKDRKAIRIGAFTVTPYLVDHSAFDAYALQVEAEGRRLFYSGDFRGHGRKRRLFDRLLEHPPEVDALLMEGTRITGRNDGFRDEEAVEQALADLLKREPGKLALATFSAQNADRLVTVYKACRKARRSLVVDPYTAYVLQEIQPFAKLPQVDWDGIKVIRTRGITRLMNARGLGDFISGLPKAASTWREIEAGPGRHLLVFRDSMIPDMERLEAVREDRFLLVFSLWAGYLRDDQSFGKYNAFARKHGVEPIHLHTSGHASVEDLRRFASALGKKRLVPIHTFNPGDFRVRLPGVNVTQQQDGVPFEV